MMTQAKVQVSAMNDDDEGTVQAGVQDLGSRSIDNLVGAVGELSGAESCYSVLVETGGYHPQPQ